jgi:protein TonB
MLERLVASDPGTRGLGRSPSAALSVVLHGALIAAAVAATRAAPSTGPLNPAPGDPYSIVFPEPARSRGPVGDPAPFPVIDPRTLTTMGQEIPDFPVTVPVGIAAPDSSFRPLGRPGTGPSTTPGTVGGGGGGDAPPVISVAAADEAPLLLAHAPLPYPPRLREAGLAGTVVLEMIVDSTGAPEPASFRVVSSTHPGFEAAARRALLSARYRPGRWRGRPVRVLIRQPVEFRLM